MLVTLADRSRSEKISNADRSSGSCRTWRSIWKNIIRRYHLSRMRTVRYAASSPRCAWTPNSRARIPTLVSTCARARTKTWVASKSLSSRGEATFDPSRVTCAGTWARVTRARLSFYSNATDIEEIKSFATTWWENSKLNFCANFLFYFYC